MITFIQVNYSGLGTGKSIMIIRGGIMREYHYSSKNVAMLMQASPNWESKFYHDRMTIQPK